MIQTADSTIQHSDSTRSSLPAPRTLARRCAARSMGSSYAMSNINITTKILDIANVYASHAIPRRMLDEGYGGRWDVQARLHDAMDCLVLTVCGFLAADQIEVIDIKYPLDWRESLKERWAPKWVLARWPVRYKTHHIDLKAVFPRFALPAQLGPSIRIQTHTWGVSPYSDE